ncbi:MAG: hypothetical protein ACYC0M_12005 [Burkholderiales bacterium]
MDCQELRSQLDVVIKKSSNEIIDSIFNSYVQHVDQITIEEFRAIFITEGKLSPEYIQNVCQRHSFPDEVQKQIIITFEIILNIAYVYSCLEQANYPMACEHLMKAARSEGILFSLHNILVVENASINFYKKEVASKGGKTKAENKYKPLRDRVSEIYTADKFSAWQSLRDASIKIYARIKKEDEGKEIPLAILEEGQYIKTIQDWIKKIPDYKNYLFKK